jgi:hypothetical protein
MSILQLVVNHYQKNLTSGDRRGLDFLMKQGIKSHEALKAFQVGFANGGVTKLIPKEEMDQMKEVGLADRFGRNRFKSSITIPLYNFQGELVDVIGQNLGRVGAIKTIGKEGKGIGNLQGLEGTDELLITEYPILALKAYQEGFHNVILSPGEKMIKQLRADKITVLSFTHGAQAAAWVNAEEVRYCHFTYRNKSVSEALESSQVYRRREIQVFAPSKSKTSILDRVVRDLDRLGYVGEATNKKLAYLVSISRKLPSPLSAIIVSSSGAGKTGLMNAVGKLVPPEDKLFLSRLTPQALFYMPDGALVEKLIVVDERNGSSMADYSIRTMQTSNVLTLARPPKGTEDDGGIKTIEVRCAYMESTTSEEVNPENSSRCFILHLDESPESTEQILKAQRMARDSTLSYPESILDWHHRFQNELKSYPVIIPYVSHLIFPSGKVIYRREQEKFLRLIEASALLHQKERQLEDGRLLASLEDYEIAHDLYIKIFEDMQVEVSRNASEFLRALEQESITEFNLRDAITLTGWSYSMTYRTIRELLKYEYLKRDNEVKGKKQVFTLLDYSSYGYRVGKLLSPQDLSKTFSKALQEVFKPTGIRRSNEDGLYSKPLQIEPDEEDK